MGAAALDGRVAIVTGGGRGLGRAMTLGLARAGLRVVAAALARWQRLDILVNNAGRGMKHVSDRFLTEPTRFWEVAPDVWRMVIDANVNGPFLMARAAVPHLRAAGWGRVINITMNHETMRRRGFSPYGPSKAALESETAIWAQDLEGSGVTVNALLPGGATLTGMIPTGLDASIRAQLLAPEIMVAPLLWLASPAADAVSGQRLVANRWQAEDPAAAFDDAGWTAPG
jgi:NAD(P)-dependent dehydrogenase (short-subunit alcohol dehydrogenase family)